MLDTEIITRQGANRNTTFANYKTEENSCIPDQTRNCLLLKEIIELRAIQNSIKNKLRKVLFAADTSKSLLSSGQLWAFIFSILFLTPSSSDKQGVLPVEEFYTILSQEGPLKLSDLQKTRIKKLFVNIKDNNLSYSTVLKSLEFDG